MPSAALRWTNYLDKHHGKTQLYGSLKGVAAEATVVPELQQRRVSAGRADKGFCDVAALRLLRSPRTVSYMEYSVTRLAIQLP